MQDEKELLEQEKLTITVEEAAKMLGVGKNLMLEIVKMDDFPAVQFNRKILINKKQFVEWFNHLSQSKLNLLYIYWKLTGKIIKWYADIRNFRICLLF